MDNEELQKLINELKSNIELLKQSVKSLEGKVNQIMEKYLTRQECELKQKIADNDIKNIGDKVREHREIIETAFKGIDDINKFNRAIMVKIIFATLGGGAITTLISYLIKGAA